MKIIVFGATGGVGQQVVKQALKKGIKVTAFVRTPSKITLVDEALEIIQGDAFNKEEVAAAIAGHDVAHFIVKALSDEKYENASIGISK